MTDKAKELNDLADSIEQMPLNGAGLASWQSRQIINALRFAATMEEFGELPGAALEHLNGHYRAYSVRDHRPFNQQFCSTLIEAMRAAIDAAKSKPHEHDDWTTWVWSYWADLQSVAYGRTCCECGALETSFNLVPAKEGE